MLRDCVCFVTERQLLSSRGALNIGGGQNTFTIFAWRHTHYDVIVYLDWKRAIVSFERADSRHAFPPNNAVIEQDQRNDAMLIVYKNVLHRDVHCLVFHVTMVAEKILLSWFRF